MAERMPRMAHNVTLFTTLRGITLGQVAEMRSGDLRRTTS